MEVRAKALSPDEWAPFGWLPRSDTDPADGGQRLMFEWADPHVNLISHSLDEVAQVPGGLRCDEMFRHDTHTQVLLPLDAESVVAVAPAEADFDDEADWPHVAAFLVSPLQAFVLHRGTWHWGPYPVGAPLVTLFNVQGRRYGEDNRRTDLAAAGRSVDILGLQ